MSENESILRPCSHVDRRSLNHNSNKEKIRNNPEFYLAAPEQP